MKKAAVSACLTGRACRYDGSDNRNERLLKRLEAEGYVIVPFCPEEPAFGTPRPTMDLIRTDSGIRAVSNKNGQDLSFAIEGYARKFFDEHDDIALFVGKDRSPSCGVCSARVYDTEKTLLNDSGCGLMAAEAVERGITAYDAERYLEEERE